MRETDFLNIIKNTLHNAEYLGDDCAYLKDLNIYVTQDTLVEDVHFSMLTTNAFDLGKKAVAVNLSDLAACASKPLYITVSLSLPPSVNNEFVKDFYKGIDQTCRKYNVTVIGGDLTGSDKIFISICAIGKKVSKYNVSRKHAKTGDIVIVTGTHGDSAAGLKFLPKLTDFTKYHLNPIPKVEEGLILGLNAQSDFAMMDSSDGLADALFKISKESNVKISVDFEKIPVNPSLKRTCPHDYENLVLWGGEDFELIACVNESVYEKLDKTRFFAIGCVLDDIEDGSVEINNNGRKIYIDEAVFNKKSFNHFEEE